MAETSRIFIVDDTSEDLTILSELLSDFRRNFALSGADALNQLSTTKQLPDLILLDIVMPGMDGFEVCRRLKGSDRTREIPVVFITAMGDANSETTGLGLGAVDYISKPYNSAAVKARVKTHLALKKAREALKLQNLSLEEQVAARTDQLAQALVQVQNGSLETILRLSRAAEFKDECTGEHVIRMSRYSAAIARRLTFPEKEVEKLLHAAPMHDVGKIGIPDSVLLKPGKLDAKEWECMKSHTLIGAKIMTGSSSEIIQLAETVALTHHEKWDGSGYPHQLSGEQIPIFGRIVAIADVFDALTSQRPYKKAFTVEEATEIIEQGRNVHFDPAIVDAFLVTKPELLEIKSRFKDGNSAMFAKDMDGAVAPQKQNL
jgi:putative two-component system response regulator